MANFLLEKGIRKGDRCAVLLRNSIDYVISYYGILKTGAVVVPINTGIDGNEICTIIADCLPVILVSESFFSEKLNNIVGNTPPFSTLLMIDNCDKIEACGNLQLLTFDDVLSNVSSEETGVNISDPDLASIIYTSGSTGHPKGVILSHINIVENTKSIVSYLDLGEDDKIMVILPFYYVYGKSLLNTHFYAGGTVVIDNGFIFPNVILKNMIANKVTGFSGVPSTYSILLNKSNIRKLSFPHLRYLTQAGGHMPRTIKEELIELLPDKEIFIMYGATEASARLSYLEPDKLSEKIDSIGRAIPGVELKLKKEDGSIAKTGEEGEIVARGLNIMCGYWNNQEETNENLQNGWYCTGDLAVQDEEGCFYIVGRKKDMIKVGIHKVSAKEIEEVLYQHKGICEAAVIGVQDELLGEALKAYVVLNNGFKLKAEEIISFCEPILADYKIPKQIVFIGNLPKNESGKVMKQEIKNIN
jgi:acyl-CoA synthetase (AMP-forming)/AMP-acid ligase II